MLLIMPEPVPWGQRGGRHGCVLAGRQAAVQARRHGWFGHAWQGRDRGSVSVDKIYTDMAEPREVELRGTAADQLQDGLDMVQVTRTFLQTHTKAPAVAAMTRTSLRLGAFCMLPRRSGHGYASHRAGVEMT
ncbi:hypothetical protein CK936_21460 [Streptomyces albireticuli]|uniref:Uncharacterized protein n=1 Tax=Streptomyces albireticuli TaxID=1940 RepID=A0A2A2D607_9ACTN|nr:hypothetical protein CK936_21460 [Streptomyces albireticuli]